MNIRGLLSFAGFLAMLPAANWLIGHVGTECVAQGPCLVPVAPGLYAPSGVLLVGAALVLRDAVHEQLGLRAAVLAIAAGGVLSALIAPPVLVLASVAAFVLSEALDLAVYQPLRKRHLAKAVLLSGIAGACVDSAVFLWLAFGSLVFIEGQILGKLYASAAVAIYFAWRGR